MVQVVIGALEILNDDDDDLTYINLLQIAAKPTIAIKQQQ